MDAILASPACGVAPGHRLSTGFAQLLEAQGQWNSSSLISVSDLKDIGWEGLQQSVAGQRVSEFLSLYEVKAVRSTIVEPRTVVFADH